MHGEQASSLCLLREEKKLEAKLSTLHIYRGSVRLIVTSYSPYPKRRCSGRRNDETFQHNVYFGSSFKIYNVGMSEWQEYTNRKKNEEFQTTFNLIN